MTADGRRLVASDDENPDLFWALRGGGGNFGIATRLRYRLHPIGDVLFGDIVLPATRDILRRLVPTLLAAPDDLTAMPYVAAAPPDPSIPDELHGSLLLHLQVLWAGSPEDGERALAPLRALGPAVKDTVKLTPYPDVYPEHAPDPEAPPMGWACRSVFIDAFDDDVIEVVERRLAESTTPWALVQLRVLGGAVGRVALDATAYGWRDRTILAWLITPYTDLRQCGRARCLDCRLPARTCCGMDRVPTSTSWGTSPRPPRRRTRPRPGSAFATSSGAMTPTTSSARTTTSRRPDDYRGNRPRSPHPLRVRDRSTRSSQSSTRAASRAGRSPETLWLAASRTAKVARGKRSRIANASR